MTTLKELYDSLTSTGHKISQTKLAEILGTGKANVSLRLKKNSKITLAELKKIEKFISKEYCKLQCDTSHNNLLKVLKKVNICPKQRELAEILGLNTNTIGARASRNSDYSIDELKKIGDYYGINLVAFLFNELALYYPTSKLTEKVDSSELSKFILDSSNIEHEKNMTTTGQRIKKIRKELGLSVAKLAEKLEMSVNTLTNYEQNRREPSLKFFVQLDKKLDINLNWFVSGKGEMFSQKIPQFEQVKDELLSEVRQMLKDEGIIK